jgi:hypothetical protein
LVFSGNTQTCSSIKLTGKRSLFERLFDRVVPPTALVRFLGYVRPHLGLVAGGSVMGILKFTLPLAFPLAFKYVFDVLLVRQPHPEHLNHMIDRWCSSLAATLHLGVERLQRRALSVRADVSLEDQERSLVDAALNAFQRIDNLKSKR